MLLLPLNPLEKNLVFFSLSSIGLKFVVLGTTSTTT
jgi:hypothetical protein